MKPPSPLIVLSLLTPLSSAGPSSQQQCPESLCGTLGSHLKRSLAEAGFQTGGDNWQEACGYSCRTGSEKCLKSVSGVGNAPKQKAHITRMAAARRLNPKACH